MKNETRGWMRLLRLSFIISLALLAPVSAFSQDAESPEKAETTGEDAEEPPLPEKKLEPVFPDENRDLVFVEGEDAVSTNFNREPTLNYATSGSRALQLNRSTGLQGGTAFYADFVFYVPDGGTYELWYGGTPPGPLDELYPAYASPFRYSLDNEDPRDVYREDVMLVEQYTPVYYWNLIGER